MSYNIVDGKPASYLGDGVYALFDGYGIWLRANDHRRSHMTGEVYLEPSVLTDLNRFSKEAEEWRQNEKRI